LPVARQRGEDAPETQKAQDNQSVFYMAKDGKKTKIFPAME
jgi:hypothetical protein